MAATQVGRDFFADSVVTFVKKYNFDGLDVDWEYPTQRGGTPEDRVNKQCSEMWEVSCYTTIKFETYPLHRVPDKKNTHLPYWKTNLFPTPFNDKVLG